MRWHVGAVAAFLILLGSSACKSRKEMEEHSARSRVEQATAYMQEARELLAEERYGDAARDAQAAGSLLRNDAAPYQLLFEILRAEGNAPAAALALKQAADLNPSIGPSLKKQLAEMYREEGRRKEAVATLRELRDGGYLDSSELCTLARLQARVGDPRGAFDTLRRVQEADPDDLEAKAVEAEALLVSGEDVLATRLMDRLLKEHPDLASARLLRARYFFNRDYVDEASADLERIQGEESLSPEVVTLKAGIFIRRHQLPEAEKLLQEAVDRSPRNVMMLAQLAETKLELKKYDDAEELIETALALRPNSTSSRYVQGRFAEAKGQTVDAIRIYQDILVVDPTMAPALSHLWPLIAAEGQKGEAMSLIERLVSLNEANIPEKVTLAEMYVELDIKLLKALKLLNEAVSREPKNVHYAQVRTRLVKILAKRQPNIVIIRGKRHG